MFNEPRKILFRALGTTLFIIILIFIYFRYSKYLKGPEITKINIEQYMVVENPSLIIRADIKNTKLVKINNHSIILKDKVKFDEIVVFSPGDNTIEINISDTFGKTKTYLYSIYYKTDSPEYIKTLNGAQKDLEEIGVDELQNEN